MIIHTLQILSFGKFKNKTISFGEGLNYIYGENEAGKSTVMAFIKAMLYGFTGRGADGDRARYSPWDGTRLQGEMELSLSDGRRIIIRRVQGKTKAQDEFTVLDAVTGEAYTVDMESEIGFGESAFLKTVFIPQMRADISGGDAELTEKLLNLATSGDTDTGYEEAKKFLADEMRFLRHQRGDGGRINALKKEITALAAELAEAESEGKAYFRYMAEEKKLSQETEALREKSSALSALLVRAKAGKAKIDYEMANERSLIAEKALESAETQMKEAKEKQGKLAVFRSEISEDAFFAQENAAPIKAEEQNASKKKMLSFSLAVVFLAASLVLLFSGLTVPFLGLLVLAFGFGALGIRFTKTQKELAGNLAAITENDNKAKAELARYGCSTLREYTEKRAELLALDETIRLLEEKYAFALCDAENKKAEANRLLEAKNQYQDVEPIDTPETEIQAKIQSINLTLLEKERALVAAKGFLQGASEGKKAPDLILSAKTCKEEELEEAEKQYAALSLASETLEEVFGELSRDFTPRINQKASEYLSQLTDKEETLLLDKKYAVTMGRGEHRPLQAFSGGTIEQAFLSVRLAIASLLVEDKKLPVFLDDAFIQYDEKREENAFKLLREIAKEKQVILFSCRKRETESAHIIEL